MMSIIPIWLAFLLLVLGGVTIIAAVIFTDPDDNTFARWSAIILAFFFLVLPSGVSLKQHNDAMARQMAQEEADKRKMMFNLRIDCISEGGQWFHEGDLYRCVPRKGP